MGEWGWQGRGPGVSDRASEEVQAEAPGTAPPPTPHQAGTSKCKGSG